MCGVFIEHDEEYRIKERHFDKIKELKVRLEELEVLEKTYPGLYAGEIDDIKQRIEWYEAEQQEGYIG